MTASRSCFGCKFLYTHGTGYSNYTWEETLVECAKDRNPNLPAEEPYDWASLEGGPDNWRKTNASLCGAFRKAAPTDKFVTLDVDGEDGPADYTKDPEAIAAICKHSERKPNGGWQ